VPPAAAPVSAAGRMSSLMLLPTPHQLACSNRG
jgi:hypothetical protein